MNFQKPFLVILFISLFIFNKSSAYATAETDIEFIIAATKPPLGVVFEIVEGSESKLEIALNKVNDYSRKLRNALPKLKLAVVSHGTEQFALLTKNKSQFGKTHAKVQSLVSEKVPVHVCGTHASWYNLSAEDFPQYVDVVDAGPAKIKEYQRKGYAVIVIDVK